jgi:HSP20 family molecular chaperone IbpA
MMKKVKRALANWFSNLSEQNQHSKEILTIQISGVGIQDIILEKEQGYLIVNGDQPMVIEEPTREKPWEIYSAFGFRRSYYLPEGIHLNEVQLEVRENELRFYQ